MGIRERTKATCVLTINEMRLDALEIGRRLVADGKLESADQIYFLTFDEFRAAARGGDVDLDRVHARQAAKADLLRYQEPLFAIAGEVPPVEEWPLKSARGRRRRPTGTRSPAPPAVLASRPGGPVS